MPPKTPRHSGILPSTSSTPNLPTYSFGDIVLAKVKGHPAWPARIVDPYASPLNLRDERKISQKNTYLVKFFKTADYAWMNAKEMSMLAPPEIKAFIDNPNKKGADLKAAYQIALAPEAWEAELETFQQQYEEQQKALEIDELDPLETDGIGKTVPLKPKQKRKRPSESKPLVNSAKKRKSPGNESSQSVTTPETPAPVAVAKKMGKKKKEEVVVPIDGESIVREWRHRLQRVFLGKTPLTEKMMPEIANVYSDIEVFEMKPEWLHSSKLAKVLKRVGVLEDSKVPLDAQYNIRARSRALQDKWRQAFGFPEDSSNRPKVLEGSEGNNSEAAQNPVKNKELEAPSDTSKSQAAVTDIKEVTVSPDLSGAKENVEIAKCNEIDHDAGTKGDNDQHDSPKADASASSPSPTTEPKSAPLDGDYQDQQAIDVSAQHTSTTADKSIHVDGEHQEAHVQDVEMAVPSNETATVEQQPRNEVDEDGDDKMDCADSPEPTSAESNDAENKDPVVSSNN